MVTVTKSKEKKNRNSSDLSRIQPLLLCSFKKLKKITKPKNKNKIEEDDDEES